MPIRFDDCDLRTFVVRQVSNGFLVYEENLSTRANREVVAATFEEVKELLVKLFEKKDGSL